MPEMEVLGVEMSGEEMPEEMSAEMHEEGMY